MRRASLDSPRRALLASRLAYHLRCLHEDTTDPEMSPLERLALVRDRAGRIREIRRELKDTKATDVRLADGKSPGREVSGSFLRPCSPARVLFTLTDHAPKWRGEPRDALALCLLVFTRWVHTQQGGM
jgi:hypothetical protein